MQYFKVSSEFTAYFIGKICSNRGEMSGLGNVVFIRRCADLRRCGHKGAEGVRTFFVSFDGRREPKGSGRFLLVLMADLVVVAV